MIDTDNNVNYNDCNRQGGELMEYKKCKEEVDEITKLILQLSPEQRRTLKQGIIIGKSIFKNSKSGDTQESRELQEV